MINLPESFRIDQLHYTSGHGGDYRIVASSTNVDQETEEEIVRNALVKHFYISPEIPFKAALRIFNLPNETTAISFVTIAGKDEFGRPGRQHAHILLLKKEYSSYFYFPIKYLVKFHKKEYSLGSIPPIYIELRELLKNLHDSIRQIEENIKEVVDNVINVDFLSVILSSIIRREKLLFLVDPNTIDIYDISAEKALTSCDLIDILLYLLPNSIRSKISVSSFSIKPLQEELNIVFSSTFTSAEEIVDRVIIDLINNQIIDGKKRLKAPKDDLSKLYNRLLRQSLKEDSFELIGTFLKTFDSLAFLAKQAKGIDEKIFRKIIKYVFSLSKAR